MRRSRIDLRILVLLASMVCGAAFAARWTVGAARPDGLPVLSRGGIGALSSTFVFWGKDWAWAGQQTEFKVTSPFEYSIAGKNQALKFELAGRVRKTAERQMVWEFNVNARSASSNVIGGGISFKFDLATFGSELGEPELLPGNRGWAWGRATGSRVEMRFDPPLASAYFERGQKSELRAFFFKDQIPEGEQRQLATLSVSGDMALGPTAAERFGLDDYTAWPTGILDSKVPPVNLSFLNAPERPAGKRGFLKAQGDKLVFQDRTVARFWGTNLTSYTLFGTSKENVRQQARRLSELGFNLVRLHHHDSAWVVPNVFGGPKAPSTQSLDAAMLGKLDWWIKCLKDEGIYVWLDLHVGRQFKAGDGIEDFGEIAKGKPSTQFFGFNYVNASIVQAMKRFNELYLNHVNEYTGLRYKDEPAIAAMLITNENDVTHHFGNALLGDKGVPRHNALYLKQAERFAEKFGLPKDKVWRSWEHGPSKLFLNDLENRFNTEMIAHLRTQGVKAPIVTTSTWGDNPLSSLPALTAGSMIDVHSGGGVGELERNPILGPNFVHWIAAAQVAGKPLSVTEWGVEDIGALSPERHSIPLYIAGIAALQGWDAVMHFAYAQEPIGSRATPSIYHAYNDPGMMSSMPAAALLFRQAHVKEATTTYVFAPSKEVLFNQPISAANSVALRTAAERGKLVVAMPQVSELPWLDKSAIPPDAKVMTDPRQSQFDPAASEVVSDSGELRRNWERGIFTINTPRSQAAMGWIGGATVALADVEIAVTTRNATVAVQSLDGNPIGRSKKIMISLGARSVSSTSRSLPFYSEPIEGRVLITAPKGLTARVWDIRAETMREVQASYRNGRYSILLDESLRSYWLALDARPAAAAH